MVATITPSGDLLFISMVALSSHSTIAFCFTGESLMCTTALELLAPLGGFGVAGGGVSSKVLLAFLIGVGSLELTEKLGFKTLEAEGEESSTLLEVACKGKAAALLD